MASIDSYGFGKIVVDGVIHTNDIIILPDGEVKAWWRREGHNLETEDLSAILETNTVFLSIGTGMYGAMHVTEELVRYLTERGIGTVVAKTSRAVEQYNIKDIREKAAALHLTC